MLAYGQSGAGKTFTMEGLTRLAAAEIFQGLAASGGRLVASVSVLEVHFETVRDLVAGRAGVAILMTPGGIAFEGLSEVAAPSAPALLATVKRALAQRVVGATLANPASSRSHVIVRIRLAPAGGGFAGNRPGSARLRPGAGPASAILTLADLAGSEHVEYARGAGWAAVFKEARFLARARRPRPSGRRRPPTACRLVALRSLPSSSEPFPKPSSLQKTRSTLNNCRRRTSTRSSWRCRRSSTCWPRPAAAAASPTSHSATPS